MTSWDEYLTEATRFIVDPEQAEAVRQELRAHLEDAADDLLAEGLDTGAAAELALSRMGSAAQIALDLGEAHHRPLPWRLYLAPVALGAIASCLWIWWPSSRAWEMALRWVPLLLFALWPDRPRWQRPGLLLLVDARVKWRWLRRQTWTGPLLTGVPAGVAGALVWGFLGRWPILPGYMALLPLLAAWLVTWVQRRLWPAPAPLTFGCAALAFPAAFYPGYLRWWQPAGDWPILIALSAILFGLAMLGAGWAAQLAEARGWTVAAILTRIAPHHSDE